MMVVVVVMMVVVMVVHGGGVWTHTGHQLNELMSSYCSIHSVNLTLK